MSLRFHEISESRHHILNPVTPEELHLLREICEVHEKLFTLSRSQREQMITLSSCDRLRATKGKT